MPRSAYLPIPADRYEACVRTIRFRGLDLRGAPLRAQVRLRPDTPGAPELDLRTVTNGFAEGLRVTDFAFDGAVPVTTVEMVVNETTMEALPYAGEIGDASPLAYDLQATISGRKRKLIGGEFVVLPGVTGADAAPASRPGGDCVPRGGWTTWSTAEVDLRDELVKVTIDGTALDPAYWLGAIERAEDARAATAARAALYGVEVIGAARLFTADSVELAFAERYQRAGFEALPRLADVPGWSYARAGIGSAQPPDGRLVFFEENAPRLTGAGLLIEGAVTNVVRWSEDLTQAPWALTGAQTISNVAPGPRGDGTMDKLVGTGAGVHRIAQAVAGVSTFSIYARAAERRWCAIEIAAGGTRRRAFFDLVTGGVGTVSPGVTARIERAAGGSWRISGTLATTDATVGVVLAAGDGIAEYDAVGAQGGGIYLDCAQAEASARPYSYVGTSAIPATCNADVAALDFAPGGDATVYVEAILPPQRGTDDALVSLTGARQEDRIALYRNSAGTICLQLGDYDADRLDVLPVATIADGTLVRAAFTIRGSKVLACAQGGEVVGFDLPPAGLKRLWIGIIHANLGFPLNGRVRSTVASRRAMSNEELQSMTSTPLRTARDQAGVDALRQQMIAHANDGQPHGLPSVRRQAELADGKTGLWAVVAADSFTGTAGALANTETGALPWVAVGAGQPLHRIGGVARTPDGALRGTYIAAGVSDGQVEADLTPGTLEASIYFRWVQNGDYLMLQRGSDGAIGLKRFIAGAVSNIAPVDFLPIFAGERFKIRFVGPRIWVFRIAGGVERLIFDVSETRHMTAGGAGLRLNGTGSADNFRLLKRESL